MERIGILFVCTGNICRSPTAQGIFEQLLHEAKLSKQFMIDSAGVSGSHAGQAPDPRSQQAAKARGVDLSRQRARKIKPDDIQSFDYVIAMDKGHHESLVRMQADSDHAKARLHLLMEFAPTLALEEVPDPYYGPLNGFQRVFDIIDAGCRGLFDVIQQQRRL